MDIGLLRRALAIFDRWRSAGIAPRSSLSGVGAIRDLARRWPDPRLPCWGGGAVRDLRHRARALTLNDLASSSFDPAQAAAIGIIGGADGPAAICLSASWRRSCGAIAVAASPTRRWCRSSRRSSKALTTDKAENPHVAAAHGESAGEDLFPAVLLLLVALLLPDAAPLLGRRFGNLIAERGGGAASDPAQRADQHSDHLPRTVGGRAAAAAVLQPQTLGIRRGAIALCADRRRVLMAKLMNVFSRHTNLLIGRRALGVPMAARVPNRWVWKRTATSADVRHRPNVAGVIGRRSPPGDAQVRAGDVSQPVPAAGKPAAEISIRRR